jgi:hypothetical protein
MVPRDSEVVLSEQYDRRSGVPISVHIVLMVAIASDRRSVDLDPLGRRQLPDGDWELRARVPDGAVFVPDERGDRDRSGGEGDDEGNRHGGLLYGTAASLRTIAPDRVGDRLDGDVVVDTKGVLDPEEWADADLTFDRL